MIGRIEKQQHEGRKGLMRHEKNKKKEVDAYIRVCVSYSLRYWSRLKKFFSSSS